MGWEALEHAPPPIRPSPKKKDKPRATRSTARRGGVHRETAGAQGAQEGRQRQRGKQREGTRATGRGGGVERSPGAESTPVVAHNATYLACPVLTRPAAQTTAQARTCRAPCHCEPKGGKGSEVVDLALHRARPHQQPHQGKTRCLKPEGMRQRGRRGAAGNTQRSQAAPSKPGRRQGGNGEGVKER